MGSLDPPRRTSQITASECDDVFALGNVETVTIMNIDAVPGEPKPKSILKRNSSYCSFLSMGSIDESVSVHSTMLSKSNGSAKNIGVTPSTSDDQQPQQQANQSSPPYQHRRLERTNSNVSTVSFQSVDVREYQQTLGDNPSCTYGPPVSLDWSYTEASSMNLEDYEKVQQNSRRRPHQWRMSKRCRENMLKGQLGYSDEEIKAAKKEKKKIQRGRSISQVTSPFWRLEDAIQSIGRKLKGKDKSKELDKKGRGEDYHDTSLKTTSSTLSTFSAGSSQKVEDCSISAKTI